MSIKVFLGILLLSKVIGTDSLIYCDKRNAILEASPNIINGKRSHPNTYPYMAGLRMRLGQSHYGRIFCGATIIGASYILTAAHCVAKLTIQLYVICTHCHDSTKNYHMYVPQCSFVHEEYNEENSQNDIAIVQVTSNFNFTNAKLSTLCLQLEDKKGLFDVLLLGWGSIEHNSTDYSEHLREGLVTCSQDFCNLFATYFPKNNISYDEKTMVCCDGTTHSTGYGDSGGPLVNVLNGNMVQAGVMNSFIKINQLHLTVALKISFYSTWILSTMTMLCEVT